ncbi:MAG: 50S ribosomal protein L9 [Nitrospirae bacterium]|nr:50S ribosomal protein L9 [Nitrospirota bacterium]
MKVILKEDVKGLGTMGAVVNVANGYGRNFLLPRNLAVEASTKNLKQFEHEKNIILTKAKKVRRSTEDLAKQISALSISIEALSGEEGKLFGSVTTMDIADAIAKQGIEIDKRKILLDEPIKKLGTYNVSIKLLQDVTANVTVEVKQAATAEA